jgi:hypothetical protein
MTDLTRQLRGRHVVSIETNGSLLALRMADGAEILIKWIDPETGTTLKGWPVIGSKGWRLQGKAKEIVTGQSLGLPS